MGRLARDYLPADLIKATQPHDITGSVAVQARQTIQETEWLLELAANYSFIRGVVGWVDLRSPSVSEDLERFSENDKFVGVRHVVQDEPDPRFLLGNDFVRGLRYLPAYNLTYDILVFPHQLPAAYDSRGDGLHHRIGVRLHPGTEDDEVGDHGALLDECVSRQLVHRGGQPQHRRARHHRRGGRTGKWVR